MLFIGIIYASSGSSLIAQNDNLDSIAAVEDESIVDKEINVSDFFLYTIGKSHVYKNLQIFLLFNEKNVISKNYVTLSDALEKEYVTVFETGSVNMLEVENTSSFFVFIGSGEIVKGGKQDRTIGKDIILPPKSGKFPLASFCVESGRWQQREGEELHEFKSSEHALSSRDIQIAAKISKSQGEVWQNVEKQQQKVNESMVINYDYDDSFDVKDSKSETSLQLTLENKDLEKVKEEYRKFFHDVISGNDHVMGFVYAINGEIYGIDIYHNYKLFLDLWPKLLDAVIVEAISDMNKEDYDQITAANILTIVKEFEGSEQKTEKEEINSETTYVISYAGKINKFETFDKREGDKLLHLNYIQSGNTSPSSEKSLRYQNNIQSNQVIR